MKGFKRIHKDHFVFWTVILFLLFISACKGLTPGSPVIHLFSASSYSITQGHSVTLFWNTNASSVSIDQGVGPVSAPSGTMMMTPDITTTYTLTAINSNGDSTASITIEVLPGDSISKTYTIIATAGTGGFVSPSGNITVAEGDSQTFTITTEGCYMIDEILIDGLPIASTDIYTFTNIQHDHEIFVSFAFPSRRIYNFDTGIEYEIIQHAIDDAIDGETIIVCPGTYFENIELDSRDLILRSSDPSDSAIISATIIDGKDIGSVVRLVNDTSTVMGFTIQNGKASYGGGIYIDDSSSIVKENNIINNDATFDGGGIYVYKSIPRIIGNSILGNKAKTAGGGIFVDNFSSPVIGGANAADTSNFNTICSNAPDQIEPNIFPNNHISNMCMFMAKD